MKKDETSAIQISQFDYPLPDNRIAKYPLASRDSSKLLLYNDTGIETRRFTDLPDLIPEGSLLIFNNTKVIHARLIFQKESGAFIEIFCLTPAEPVDYQLNFASREGCSWSCMIGNARRWKGGALSMEIEIEGKKVILNAEKVEQVGTEVIVSFSWDNPDYSFSELLNIAGSLPIPPYLNRAAEASDDDTYQTLYSKVEGSVAAPTAGLHFTPEVMAELHAKGIQTAEVTLHVGAGTFKPVKSDTLAGHEMHSEFISVSKDTIERLINNKGKLVVVGTTSLRTVESLYYIGKKLENGGHDTEAELSVSQWEPYEEADPISPQTALENILNFMQREGTERVMASTSLLIAPGYDFHFPDALITNFHQPQSTLLLLVSAFVGGDWRAVYDYALDNDFRFLSYGDSSLLCKKIK